MKIVREHEPIGYDSSELKERWNDGMCLSPQSKGGDKCFFRWQKSDNTSSKEREDSSKGEDKASEGYYASYIIGAQWLDETKTDMPLVVTPKREDIDFLKMFSTCFHSGIEAEAFSKIYDIDMEQPQIKVPKMQSVLNPLIVVHFLLVVRDIVKRGLKKDYIQREENLNKVKGHIAMLKNERCNVIRKRFDKIYCKYQDYSEDIPENRLLKKALLFSFQILNNPAICRSLVPLRQRVKELLSYFNVVDECIEVWEIKNIKHHKIFKEYNEAIKLAKMILQQYDYSIANISLVDEYVPVFWLDMSLLYEHYVLGLLRETYGNRIKYQVSGYTGKPDFICYDPQIIMDTKYIYGVGQAKIDKDIARQLSAYSRDCRLFKVRPSQNIPCIIIYPNNDEGNENPFKDKPLDKLTQDIEAIEHLWDFYRIGVPLPKLSMIKPLD